MYESITCSDQFETDRRQTVVVVGGGLGGLFTGALLAKNGRVVTVLEKNRAIGGGLHTFRRGGVEYATGMHVFGGFNEGNIMDRICRYLGIDKSLRLVATDADCMDEVFTPCGRYRIPQGRENYVGYLATLFPHEAEGIRQYVDALYRLASAEMSSFLDNASSSGAFGEDQFLWPADALIDYYVADPRLRSLLSYLAPLYSGIKGETPAFEHAMVNVLHIDGSSMFASGSQRMADALAGVIRDAGGEIVTGCEVERVVVAERRAVAVETVEGRRFEADQFVWAVDPRQLVEKASGGTFPQSFCNRVKEATYSYSAFKLYLKLGHGMISYTKHPMYFFNGDDERGAWNAADVPIGDWPRCAMAVMGGEQGTVNGEQTAETMTVVAPMSYDWFGQWSDSVVGHRPEDYYLFKKKLEQKLFALLRRYMPELEGSVESVFSSTPLTIRDYNGIHRGSMYGFHKDCNHIMYTKMSVNTKVGNLFMTGQSVNLHGMCGVAITSVMAAEAIMPEKKFLE